MLDQVLKCTKVYLKASPSGVPSIMCLAQKWGHWTPFSRMSQIPWRWSSALGETWETYVETIYTDSEGQDKNVPASTEASHRPANKEESEKPEEGPDWVATTRSQASTSCHLESSPETENKASQPSGTESLSVVMWRHGICDDTAGVKVWNIRIRSESDCEETPQISWDKLRV